MGHIMLSERVAKLWVLGTYAYAGSGVREQFAPCFSLFPVSSLAAAVTPAFNPVVHLPALVSKQLLFPITCTVV